MPTGPGGSDAQGIWQFGEDDADALSSDLLNRLAESVSTELAVDRGRLTAAEGEIDALQLLVDRIIPTAATNGSVSATGVVTSTAQSNVRVRTAFPSGFTVFDIYYDLTTSAASSINARLAVDATDAATAYDNQRSTQINASAAAVQSGNQPDLQLSPIAVAGRHVGRIRLTNPNVAAATFWEASTFTSANPMTASSGRSQNSGLHRTGTAYNSFNLIPASGNITVNRLTIKGVS